MEKNNNKYKNDLIESFYKIEKIYSDKILNNNLKEKYEEMLKKNSEYKKNIFDLKIIELDEQLDKPVKSYITIEENNNIIL